MSHKKVVVKRVISPDGRVIAEATSVSVVASSGDSEHSTETVYQTVNVQVSESGSWASSSSSSHSSS